MNLADVEAPSSAIPAPTKSTTPGRRLMPRTGPEGVGAFLRAHGFLISDYYLNNICAPLVDEGPKPVMFWNRRPLYDETVLDWAEARGRRQLEDAKARAERLRAARDAALERREARKQVA
jgi:hypothetical protein